jgi:hypothetical protein
LSCAACAAAAAAACCCFTLLATFSAASVTCGAVHAAASEIMNRGASQECAVAELLHVTQESCAVVWMPCL